MEDGIERGWPDEVLFCGLRYGVPLIKRKTDPDMIVCLLPCFLAFAGSEWQVYFSPDGGAADAIVVELNKATIPSSFKPTVLHPRP